MTPRSLFFYALPAIPLAALTLPLYIIVPTFYTETLGLPLASIGAVLLAVRIIDAINDPLIGYAADKMRFGLGRRRMAFALGVPIAALAGYALFAPPADAGVFYVLVWASLLTVGFTAVLLPYAAWGAELSGDYHERSRIVGVRESVAIVGTLVAISVPFVVGMSDAEAWHGLAILGVLVSFTLCLFGALAIWQVPEPKDHSKTTVGLKEGLRQMKHNTAFVRLIVAYLINGLANAIPATLFLYFVSAVLGDGEQRGPLLFLYFAAGLFGIPIALFVARKVNKHRAWCYAMIIACCIFAFVPMLGLGDLKAFAIICVLTGLCLGFDLALPSSIQADVIDLDTAQSGEQRSGAYFAGWSLATKLSLALAVGLSFPALSRLGFDPDLGVDNDPSSLMALAVLYAWVPIALKGAAIALMWNFPLDVKTQLEVRSRIEA